MYTVLCPIESSRLCNEAGMREMSLCVWCRNVRRSLTPCRRLRRHVDDVMRYEYACGLFIILSRERPIKRLRVYSVCVCVCVCTLCAYSVCVLCVCTLGAYCVCVLCTRTLYVYSVRVHCVCVCVCVLSVCVLCVCTLYVYYVHVLCVCVCVCVYYVCVLCTCALCVYSVCVLCVYWGSGMSSVYDGEMCVWLSISMRNVLRVCVCVCVEVGV